MVSFTEPAGSECAFFHSAMRDDPVPFLPLGHQGSITNQESDTVFSNGPSRIGFHWTIKDQTFLPLGHQG